MNTTRVYADVFRILTTTPCVARWDDEGEMHVDPLTIAEATAAAGPITAYIANTYTERKTA